MRVLVVEDDANKRAPLRTFFGKYFPDYEVAEEESLIPAVSRARAELFDLIILDMTLPFYPGEKAGVAGTHTFGGEEFLSQLDRKGIAVPVIIFSQFVTFGEPPDVKTFDQLAAELKLTYPDLFSGAVYYHASKSDWIDQLRDAVASVSSQGHHQ